MTGGRDGRKGTDRGRVRNSPDQAKEVARRRQLAPGKTASTALLGNATPSTPLPQEQGQSAEADRTVVADSGTATPEARSTSSWSQTGFLPPDLWDDSGRIRRDDSTAEASRAPAGLRVDRQDPPRAALSVQSRAADGVAGSGAPLPHRETIQAAFGRHDIGQLDAHVGGTAAEAAAAMGAQAYATGNSVAFAASPDLHTAAHEAAHVVQQRAGVLQLRHGVGQVGDAYEQHADAVADRVVRDESAETLLDQFAGGGASDTRPARVASGVQMSPDPAVHDHAGRLRSLADSRDPSNPNNSLTVDEMYEAWRSHWCSREVQARNRLEGVKERLRSEDPLGYAEKKERIDAGLPDALGPDYRLAAAEVTLCSAQISSMEEIRRWLEGQETLGRRVTLDQVNRHALEWAEARDTWGSAIQAIFLLGLGTSAAAGAKGQGNARPVPGRGAPKRLPADEVPASGRGPVTSEPPAAESTKGALTTEEASATSATAKESTAVGTRRPGNAKPVTGPGAPEGLPADEVPATRREAATSEQTAAEGTKGAFTAEEASATNAATEESAAGGVPAATNAPLQLPALTQSTRSAVLQSANRVLDHSGVTAVGRAIQKHGSRPGSFFTAGRNPAANARIGASFVQSLLDNPSATATPFTHKVHGPVVNVRMPSGAGVQFSQEGKFIGLLEPYTPR